MQSANAIGNSESDSACANGLYANQRNGAAGIFTNSDGERGQVWQEREVMLGAAVAINGSKEKAYFTDKLNANIAADEGSHGTGYGSIPGMTCDAPGTGVYQPYCGSSSSTANAYGWAFQNRNLTISAAISSSNETWIGNGLGSLTVAAASPVNDQFYVDPPLCTDGVGCTEPGGGNANFQQDYHGLVYSWLNALGMCPGNCQLSSYSNNWFIDAVEDPNSNMYVLGQYVYPTMGGTAMSPTPLTSFSGLSAFYEANALPSTWASDAGCQDEGYGAESLANLSYAYNATSIESYSGATAYNAMRPSLLAFCVTGSNPQFNGANGGTPKWDITPNGGIAGPSTPQVDIPVISPSSGNVPQTVSMTDATGSSTICFLLNSPPTTDGAGGCTGSSSTYSSSFSQTVAGTLYAVGTESGYTDSGVTSVTYGSGGGASLQGIGRGFVLP